MFNIIFCRWLQSNCRPLELEVTALPTKPQLPPYCGESLLASRVCKLLLFSQSCKAFKIINYDSRSHFLARMTTKCRKCWLGFRPSSHLILLVPSLTAKKFNVLAHHRGSTLRLCDFPEGAEISNPGNRRRTTTRSSGAGPSRTSPESTPTCFKDQSWTSRPGTNFINFFAVRRYPIDSAVMYG